MRLDCCKTVSTNVKDSKVAFASGAKMRAGVPQGCLMSPVLFNLYAHDKVSITVLHL